MRSSWHDETGRLAWRWSGVGRGVQEPPQWLLEFSEMPSGHLPPVTDFASHSPFGGPSWFQPHPIPSDFE
jgi:hypothetical protein